MGAVDWRRHKGRTSGSEQTRGFREFRKGPLRVSVKGFFKPTLGFDKGSIRISQGLVEEIEAFLFNPQLKLKVLCA